MTDAEWQQILAAGEKAINESAVKGFREIKIFLIRNIFPNKNHNGAKDLPNGLDYYQERVHHYTTTNLSYEEVYRLALKVDRIKASMQGS
jgi:uncharacterized protein (DUF885 family)